MMPDPREAPFSVTVPLPLANLAKDLYLYPCYWWLIVTVRMNPPAAFT